MKNASLYPKATMWEHSWRPGAHTRVCTVQYADVECSCPLGMSASEPKRNLGFPSEKPHPPWVPGQDCEGLKRTVLSPFEARCEGRCDPARPGPRFTCAGSATSLSPDPAFCILGGLVPPRSLYRPSWLPVLGVTSLSSPLPSCFSHNSSHPALLFFFLRFYLFIFREKGGEGERETSMCGCLSCTPYWGPGPQPRHVP